MTRWFKGIDFANQARKVGVCYLEVTNGTLTAHPNNDRGSVERTGIDCPFGTSRGFWMLLHNQAPRYPSDDAFKTRHTDRWLREHLWKYQTNRYWRDHIGRNPPLYFNQTAHVQPAVGLQIVPGFLDWFRNEVGDDEFGIAVEAARCGESTYVEAHPRAFLYSAIERIWGNMKPPFLNEDSLRAVAQYKDTREGNRADNRRYTYALLSEHTRVWLGEGFRLAQAPEPLFATDHAFDAWLSALTALAHSLGRTITWSEAGIPEAFAKVEGHILVLKTERAE